MDIPELDIRTMERKQNAHLCGLLVGGGKCGWHFDSSALWRLDGFRFGRIAERAGVGVVWPGPGETRKTWGLGFRV